MTCRPSEIAGAFPAIPKPDSLNISRLQMAAKRTTQDNQASSYTATYIHTCRHAYIHTYASIHTNIHKYIITYKHTHIHVFVHAHICIYTYTYTHAYINIHIHMCIHMQASNCTLSERSSRFHKGTVSRSGSWFGPQGSWEGWPGRQAHVANRRRVMRM